MRSRCVRLDPGVVLRLIDRLHIGVRGDPCIDRPGSRASAWLLPNNEEPRFARHTDCVIAGR